MQVLCGLLAKNQLKDEFLYKTLKGYKIVSFYHTKMIQLLVESASHELFIFVYYVPVAIFSLKLYQFDNMT